MPELPEVETAKYALEKILLGKELIHHTTFTKKLRVQIPSDNQFKELYNKSISSVSRAGKTLYLKFDSGIFLSFHFGMTGFFELNANLNSLKKKHEHIKFQFSSNSWLSFFDSRKFGCVKLSSSIVTSAVDPTSTKFSAVFLFNLIKNKTSSIKSILMNQQCISGIGNIYANEALFEAGVLPQTVANSISISRAKKLCKAIKQVLNIAIISGKLQFDTFQQINEELMKFPTGAKVYSMAGETCPRCNKEKVQATKISGRNSFYCPQCQR